eukprot:COSAG06_NODE_6853_length_2745_cov_3.398715_2_plen_37_part_00
MSEFSSQAGLGIYCAHPHKCPDSEEQDFKRLAYHTC